MARLIDQDYDGDGNIIAVTIEDDGYIREFGMVRRGRWIQATTFPSYHYCSYCKSTHKMSKSCNKYVLFRYCPNCGAKMRVEDDK